ncbi:helix-turn-helix domain-containing protein [Flexithrix dorotheae]|uniref:helix-turn-helix domain-containing protein n=1 Tax=Flexithrix dorotheae TaxID=70993 RepID=UPI00036B7A28|nr:AraC family transcriptional regulator [Flexithrix dorotheae]
MKSLKSKSLSLVKNFFQPSITVADLLTDQLKEEAILEERTYGTTEVKHWWFDGIRIAWSRHRYKDHYYFEKENPLDVVNLEFNLQGTYVIHQQGREYNVKGRKHNIVYSPGFKNTFQNGALVAESLAIQFRPEVFLRMIEDGNDILNRFAENMLKGGPVVLAPNSLMLSPDLNKAINDLLNCKYRGGLRKMYLLSKSLEILVLQAEAFDQAERDKNVYCKRKADQERLLEARDFLMANVENPPGLSELARHVGMNEYKLKRGFKEMFQTTAFGFLSNFRLELALKSLLDTQKTISEIAYQLGYASPQHFSAAFKKKFGVPPSQAKK